jgi:hypothetical protein
MCTGGEEQQCKRRLMMVETAELYSFNFFGITIKWVSSNKSYSDKRLSIVLSLTRKNMGAE